MKYTSKGFSLLETLVVILIIAVLVSFAAYEYNKGVERARASEAISLLTSLQRAEEIYQMEHGRFAASFDGLKFSFAGTHVKCTQKNSSPCWGYYNTEAIQNKDWSIEIEKGKNPSISVGRISGTYAGAGFFIQLARADGVQYPLGQIACVENASGNFRYKGKNDSYCVDILDGTFYSKSSVSRKYTIPF